MNDLYLAPTVLFQSPPLEFLAAAETTGCEGVGLRLYRSPVLPFHPVVGDARLIDEMKAILARAHMRVLDIFSFYMLPETKVGDFAPALALGAEFGARYAVVQGNDPDWARMRANFRDFCALAADHGMEAVIEFMPARTLSTLPLALRLIDECGRDNAVICIDPLHLARSGGTAAEIAKIDRRLLPYAQFSDGILAPGEPDLSKVGSMGLGPGKRALPGEGNLPLADIMRALPAGLPLSVEVLPPTDRAVAPDAWAREVADSSRRFMSGLGPRAAAGTRGAG